MGLAARSLASTNVELKMPKKKKNKDRTKKKVFNYWIINSICVYLCFRAQPIDWGGRFPYLIAA